MSLSAILTAMSAIANLATTLFPQILQIVTDVETELVGATGSTKLAAALTKVEAWISDAIGDISSLTGLEAVLTPLINAAVADFNAFKTAATAVVPAAAAPATETPAAAA